MSRKRVARRVLIGLTVLLTVAIVAAMITAVTFIRRSLPEQDGRLSLPGLSGDVTVLRDERGIPQVYADDAEDLFRAQGFVHAQDRFFEMDFRRHVTAGRLSELVGADDDALQADKVVRTLGWRRVAEEELPRLSPATRRYLQAYADGVNAYIKDRSPSQLALEYVVLGQKVKDYRVEPWTPVDSLAWLKAMAWDLKTNYDDEVARARLSARLPVRRIEQLYPGYPYDRNAPILSQNDLDVSGVLARVRSQASQDKVAASALRPALEKGGVSALDRAKKALDAVPTLVGSGDGIGSNSWVVAGSHTRSGKPLLANDPHLSPSLPGIWYQMGLHCRQRTSDCPFEVAGYTFSGLPGVVIGHTDKVAWGFTNLGPDVTDLYLERVIGSTYERDGQQVPLQTREETIKVPGRRDVNITVRSTVHGPLLSDVSSSVADAGRGAPVDGEPDATTYDVALAWTALRPGRTADAIFAMDRAQDWTDFRGAARLFDVPAQNLVYADVDGNIGYQSPGLIPKRGRLSGADPDETSGRWPVAGWHSANDWQGFVPFDQLPSVLNPPEGFVATANQAVAGPEYPYALTSDWDYGYRAQRIRELLSRPQKLDVGTMSSIQLDVKNPAAPMLLPYLLRTDFSKDAFVREAQQLLIGWDGSQRKDSAAAAYYNAVWRNLLRLTFDDELPDDLRADGGDRWFEVVRNLLRRPSDAWWDDKGTPGIVEGRDEIIRRAMVEARNELTRSLGKTPTDWQWGRLHRLELEHPVLGGSSVPGPVRALFDDGPVQLPGGSAIVDANAWDAAAGYQVSAVPSMRMVVDLSNLDRSTWVNLTGQSGHPWSGHYNDQVEAWAEGETYRWPFSEKAVRAAEKHRLTLTKAPAD